MVRQHLPRVLASRISLTEDDRVRLGEELANLELARLAGPLPPALATEVVARRPLWLASILGAPRRLPLSDGLFDLVIFDEPFALVAGQDLLADKLARSVEKTLADLRRPGRGRPLAKFGRILEQTLDELRGEGTNPELLLDIYAGGEAVDADA
ncbi:hypothetical protein NGR_b19340 (plasmid) [Sinorhizobium fredii NGR234]|uniref:Uncharacterized protein n=1 Tax=Sinorhizobium fredii (strain NBRC 101917 / NGR234) TaxID=394 RepID=C3KLU5_SINFN|nr:hypothetical protein [Sinorhizobium fredii]ACP23381.1 hypothetical protein NGR_b19340 [Sinorhizobium fredii NGR234]